MHSSRLHSAPGAVRGSRAALAMLVAGSAMSITSAPAYGIAEAINYMCTLPNDRESAMPGQDPCVWYRNDQGLVLDQAITGSRSVLGVITGLFPWSGHDAFVDVQNSPPGGESVSRILLEIEAGIGDPIPILPFAEVATNATGILGAAIGYGERDRPVDFPAERPLAQGVAPDARAITASVASNIFNQGRWQVDEGGLLVSMLLMADPETAARFEIPQRPDVIVSGWWSGSAGDSSGDGFVAKLHDAITHMFGTVLIAPTGDDGGFAFPPDSDIDRPEFFTVGIPAGAFNVIGVGGTEVNTEGAGFFTEYENIYAASGRGELDFRNYASFEGPDQPGGYTLQERSRYGVDFLVPAQALRLPVSEFGDLDFDIAPTYPYSRGDEIPEPDDDQMGQYFGSDSTLFAAGIAGGVATLVQDAYRALAERRDAGDQTLPLEVLAWPQDREFIPGMVMRAILCTAADGSTNWTNQGEQGQSGAEVEAFTTQPVDLTEGTGLLSMRKLYHIINGSVADPTDPNSLPRPSTMDVPITRGDVPLARLGTFGVNTPLISGGAKTGVASGPSEEGPHRSFFGGEDPDLGDPGSNPGASEGESGREPVFPDNRPRRPPQFVTPTSPGQQFITSAIPVNAIGWDHGNMGVGDLDYEINELTSPGQSFTATLCWNRELEVNFPEITPECLAAGNCGVFGFPFSETSLKFDDLDLEVWLSDGAGEPTIQIGASESQFDNREHVVIEQLFFTTRILIRIAHQEMIYDAYRNNYAGDVPFGLSWFLSAAQEDLFQAASGRPGDLNADGAVDFSDLNIVLQGFGTTQRSADANGDGVVDFADLNLVLANLNSTI